MLLNHVICKNVLLFSPPAAVSQVGNLKSVAWVILWVTSDLYSMQLDGLVSEGEFLDITEIKRQQAEDYECITNNGVAPPDQRKVKVTVNCKHSSLHHIGDHSGHTAGPPLLCYNDVLMIYVNTVDAWLLCMNSYILILYSQVVFQHWGLHQGWLDFSVKEVNCWILSFSFI